ncbi:hypothetical protein N9D23_10160 [Rubripirellula sp.]|nr:hypothetical protein [Rubripirellula sp.]
MIRKRPLQSVVRQMGEGKDEKDHWGRMGTGMKGGRMGTGMKGSLEGSLGTGNWERWGQMGEMATDIDWGHAITFCNHLLVGDGDRH